MNKPLTLFCAATLFAVSASATVIFLLISALAFKRRNA